jgi:hypothetical protein
VTRSRAVNNNNMWLTRQSAYEYETRGAPCVVGALTDHVRIPHTDRKTICGGVLHLTHDQPPTMLLAFGGSSALFTRLR